VNPDTSAYLRGLEQEFGESSNAIRLELNKLEDANILKSESILNKKFFKVNEKHPLFSDIRSIVLKYLGFDQIIEQILKRLGNLEFAYLVGDYARGVDSGVIDLIIVGDIDKNYFLELVEKAEKMIGRKIKFVLFGKHEFSKKFLPEFHIVLWKN
jgi:predicted nucleotidyltransferase